jgi:hypothetical protein
LRNAKHKHSNDKEGEFHSHHINRGVGGFRAWGTSGLGEAQLMMQEQSAYHFRNETIQSQNQNMQVSPLPTAIPLIPPQAHRLCASTKKPGAPQRNCRARAMRNKNQRRRRRNAPKTPKPPSKAALGSGMA